MAERIKEALKKAREQRQQNGKAVPNDLENTSASGARLGSDRILTREPFRRYSAAERQRLLEHARVLDISGGETFQFAGDRDAYIHYLLSGTVALEGDTDTRTVSAHTPAAAEPLDHAGLKSHSITATVDSEVLRVPADAVAREQNAVREEAEVVPPADYTETYSGQQLAELVEEINTEHATLNEPGPSIVDPHVLLGEDGTTESFVDLAASAENALAGLEYPGDEVILTPDTGAYEPKVEDEIGVFARELEARFRRYVDNVKAEERARYEARLQAHADRLQALAEQHIATRVASLKQRYQGAHVEKERRLRERYRALRDFANKIARQKAAIYVARRQISEKLRMVEQIHSELAQLGSQLNHQLDDLDELMPDAAADTSGGES